MPSTGELSKADYEEKIASEIKDFHFNEINEHLLSFSTDSKAPKTLEAVFVLPPVIRKQVVELSENAKMEEVIYSLDDICKMSENLIIFGSKESGKTVLLDRLLVEFTTRIRQYHKIPIYFDFDDIGNRSIEKMITLFLKIGGHQAKSFLKANNVVLLIDNLTFSRANMANLLKLTDFIGNYDDVQVIATSLQLTEGDIPPDFFEFPSFRSFTLTGIKNFRTEQIRELINKWFSKNVQFDLPGKLEKMIDFLTSLHLPRTPIAISMFLWMIEQQENYKPLNQAVMLENFIEKLFKKLAKKEMYSDEFDFRNKEHLLSEIALFMLKENHFSYRVSYGDLCNFVEKSLKRKRFDDFPAEDVLQHFFAKAY